MVASESVALDALQFERLRDVRPGECVSTSKTTARSTAGTIPGEIRDIRRAFSSMSILRGRIRSLDDLSVYKARLRMGEQLAGKIVRDFPGS